ncbi:ATP-binding protein [Marinifilum sp. D714]|uniref:ATP-binding protein n=1 Tax=Marinifilum sp. D714 TaxID=2937523 RepID=UPI0027CBAFFA|nr:ATP-binding protein [Marinifilum sp. D714]MDQ2180451.1 ATP-binding protein [Marinifilum sp. D714]
MNKDIQHIKHFFVTASIGFVFLVASSLVWNIQNEKRTTYKLAKVEAIGNQNKDLTFRRWSTLHGGVYVPITDKITPNEYMDFIPNRDVTTTDGQKLTLINPAYMTRLAHELELEISGKIGHITSLNPIRPENKADEWETNALKRFESGAKEHSSIETINGKKYLRYMRPMHVEKRCLKCHTNQGYQLGDIRGGLSVAIPMDKYETIIKSKISGLIFFHIFILGIGLLLGWLAYRRTLYSVKARIESQKIIRKNERLLKIQNQELRKAKEKAEESDRLKTIFLQNMSHEIRTPMNAILGFSSLIPSEFNNKEKLKEYTEIINQRGNDLLGIINDLLDISKIESEKVELHLEQFDLNALLDEVQDVAQALQSRFEKFHINVISPISFDSENIILTSDKGRLKQVFSNLISNAFKFTLEGSITIGYHLSADRIYFHVEDTGIGIPEKDLENVFSRFTQIEQETTRIYDGTGLGLSITKGIIHLLHGQIKVESEVNRGSKFTFWIPLQNVDFEKDQQQKLQFEV